MEREQDPTETPDAVSNVEPGDVPGAEASDSGDEGFIPPPSSEMASEEASEDEPGYGA
jgi:hypothetical protein